MSYSSYAISFRFNVKQDSDNVASVASKAALRLLLAVAYWGLLRPTDAYCDFSEYMVTCF
jgi:hypothetical protein